MSKPASPESVFRWTGRHFSQPPESTPIPVSEAIRLADPINFVRKSRGAEEVAEIFSLEREEYPVGHPDPDDPPRAA